MRCFVRPIAPVLTLLLAACASDTRAPVDVPPPVSTGSGEHQHGRLIGLAIPDLGELFGTPSLQVREGAGLKLQYRGGGCVLDAYLYAPENGQGVDYHAPLVTSPALRTVHAQIRALSPHLAADRYWADEMAALQAAVLAGELA